MKEPEAAIAIMALTRRGALLALKIVGLIEGALCFLPERLSEQGVIGSAPSVYFFSDFREAFKKAWNSSGLIVCIMAAGIVVRAVAPLLKSKMVDPAVVVVDEAGSYVISLLSGHGGGANRWAIKIADLIGAKPVITTASDVSGKKSLDLLALEKGLELDRRELLPTVMARLLDGEPLWIFDPDDRVYPDLAQDYPNMVKVRSVAESGLTYGIWVSEKRPPKGSLCVALYPRNLIVGVGCNRGTRASEIVEAVKEVFELNDLALQAILNFASVDLKLREDGLIEAAGFFGREIIFHSRGLLEKIRVPSPSEIVKKHIGVSSVCEASVLASHPRVRLIVPKEKKGNVTVAVGKVSFTS